MSKNSVFGITGLKKSTNLLFLFALTCSILLQSIVFIGGIVSAESASSFFGKGGPYEYYELTNRNEIAGLACQEENAKCLAIRPEDANGNFAVYSNTIDDWALFKNPVTNTYIFVKESTPSKGYIGSRNSEDQFDIAGGLNLARSWLGSPAPTTPGEKPGLPEGQRAIWIDAFLIKMNNASYVDRDPWDSTRSYKTYSGDCKGDNELTINSFEANGEGEAYHAGKTTLYETSESSPDSGCLPAQANIDVTVTDTDKYLIGAYRQDADTIHMPAERDGKIVYDIYKRIAPDDQQISVHPQRNRYFRVEDESGQRDFGSYIETVNSDAEGRVRGIQDSGDTIFKIKDGALPKEYGDIVASNVPDGEEGAEAPDITCEIQILNPLTWIACPLIEAAQIAAQEFDNAITSRLTIETDDYFDLDNSNGNAAGFYQAWSTFRYLALILLVIIGLVMVIAQATSSPLVDAYTIKKVMPKIFIAIIGISLSWSLMKFAVDLSNVLGIGLRSIIYSPFAGLENPRLDAGASSLLGVGALGAIGALGMLGILSFAFTALLAVLIGFMVIVFREMLIILLVITAPIAIIAWILPNTQKAWKIWSDFFVKALLAFPIITMMIATGHVFAQIAAENAEENGGVDGLLWTLAAFIAYFGPYFMIPAAFRLAGGALATISGIANDKSRGGFDRLRNFRKGQSQKNIEGIKSGNRFKGGTDTNFRGRLNRGMKGATLIGKAGLNPALMRTNMRTAMNDASEGKIEEAMGNDSFKTWSGDDAKLWAARFTDRDQISAELERQDFARFGGANNRNRREEAVSQIMRSQKEIPADVFQKARIRAQAKTGTGYQDANGNFNAALMLEDINSAYGNDRNGAGAALAEMRGSLTQSGQIAGQAGYGTWAEQMELRHNGSVSQLAAHNAIMDDTIDSVQPGHAIYGKPSSAAALGAAHARRIQSIATGIQAGTHTQDDLGAALAAAAGISDAMNQASPGNGSAFANELFNQEITVPGFGAPGLPGPVATGTIRNFIDSSMAGNNEFAVRRSGYQASTLAQAQQQAVPPAVLQQHPQGGLPQPPGRPPAAPGAGGP